MTAPDTAGLQFHSVTEFVTEIVTTVYRRQLQDTTTRNWCGKWWLHPEAVMRLDALWMAWEHLRADTGTGMSIWLRDHADPHMSVLFDTEGPFKKCSAAEHKLLPRLPQREQPTAHLRAPSMRPVQQALPVTDDDRDALIEDQAQTIEELQEEIRRLSGD